MVDYIGLLGFNHAYNTTRSVHGLFVRSKGAQGQCFSFFLFFLLLHVFKETVNSLFDFPFPNVQLV